MSDSVRFYDTRKNPEGGTFPFVPLADITEAEWKALTDWQRNSIEASGFWLKTKPRPAKAEAVAEADEPAPKRSRSSPSDITQSVSDDTVVPLPTNESEAVDG